MMLSYAIQAQVMTIYLFRSTFGPSRKRSITFLTQILYIYGQSYSQVFYFLVFIVAVINIIFSSILSSDQLMFDFRTSILYPGTLLIFFIVLVFSSILSEVSTFQVSTAKRQCHFLLYNSYASNCISWSYFIG